MGYDRPTTTTTEAQMPSEISSRTPFRPVRVIVLPILVALGLGYLIGSGAFGGNVATNKPFVCTTTTTTTTPGR